ncbi:MAG TPA: ester cyclase [Ktedonobacteraceae bacterium]|nr:ester cyclase [Ktedonobacteraceae bacterium]
MPLEENKVRVRQLYEEVFNNKNLAAIDDYFAANVIDHSLPPGAPGGIEGVKLTIGMFAGAFPDMHITVEDLIAEGDRVMARWTLRGTHQGASLGMPPTGKQFSIPGVSIVRLSGGKSVEQWVIHDQFGMLQQLGLIPAPAQAAS